MTKPLGRRTFLKGIAAAPAVAQKMAEEAVGATVEAAGTVPSIANGIPPSAGLYGNPQKILALSELAKAGLLPDWAKRVMLRSAVGYDRRLEPDVACLQSVSLGNKLRLSGERRYRRAEESMGQEALDQQMMAEFFGWQGPR